MEGNPGYYFKTPCLTNAEIQLLPEKIRQPMGDFLNEVREKGEHLARRERQVDMRETTLRELLTAERENNFNYLYEGLKTYDALYRLLNKRETQRELLLSDVQGENADKDNCIENLLQIQKAALPLCPALYHNSIREEDALRENHARRWKYQKQCRKEIDKLLKLQSQLREDTSQRMIQIAQQQKRGSAALLEIATRSADQKLSWREWAVRLHHENPHARDGIFACLCVLSAVLTTSSAIKALKYRDTKTAFRLAEACLFTGLASLPFTSSYILLGVSSCLPVGASMIVMMKVLD